MEQKHHERWCCRVSIGLCDPHVTYCSSSVTHSLRTIPSRRVVLARSHPHNFVLLYCLPSMEKRTRKLETKPRATWILARQVSTFHSEECLILALTSILQLAYQQYDNLQQRLNHWPEPVKVYLPHQADRHSTHDDV